MAFALVLVAAPPGAHPENLSGYEFLLGTPCTIDNQAGKSGVSFGGWTGGGGQTADGWAPFLGDRKGLWEATVYYMRSPDFGSSVTVVEGTFGLLYKNSRTVSGTVTGGTVTWPSEGNDAGCGVNVATVNLTLSGDASAFTGCLQDLPVGTVIPPKIWGALQ